MGARRQPGSLIVFLLSTFALTWISWAVWAASLGAGRQWLRAVGWLVFYVGVFAPSLVAMWLTRKYERREGLTTLLHRVFAVDVGARWYVFALTYFLSIKIVAALIHRLGTGVWPPFSSEPWYLMAAGVLVSTPAQFGEEAGWRGYALPRLAARFGYGSACISLGVIWALWHLPLFFIRGIDTSGQPFVPYMLGVTALSVAIGWLFLRTRGSLFMAMLMHSAINNTNFAPFRYHDPTSPFALGMALPPWLTIGLLWVGAAYFLVRMRGARLTPPIDATPGTQEPTTSRG